MSVEVVRGVIAAINRGDFDAAVAHLAETAELDFSNSRGELSGRYRGREEVKRFLTTFWEPWESVQFDPDEIIELEDGRVVTVNAVRGRGIGSGAEVTATGATLWTLRDGEVMAIKLYQSKAEALEAAG